MTSSLSLSEMLCPFIRDMWNSDTHPDRGDVSDSIKNFNVVLVEVADEDISKIQKTNWEGLTIMIADRGR